MKDFIVAIEQSVKNLFINKIDKTTALLLIGFGILGYSDYKTNQELYKAREEIKAISAVVVKPENEDYSKLEKYIYSKYCNVITTFEDTNNVTIDKYSGKVILWKKK